VIMDTLLLRLYFNLFKELICVSYLFFKRAAKLNLIFNSANLFTNIFKNFSFSKGLQK